MIKEEQLNAFLNDLRKLCYKHNATIFAKQASVGGIEVGELQATGFDVHLAHMVRGERKHLTGSTK